MPGAVSGSARARSSGSAPEAGAEYAPARVSVVVPARNAGATLAACLDALAAEGVPGPGAELLLVNDGSTDDTRSIAAARPGVRVLEGPGRGPAAARNLGARAAAGDVVVFLDADTAPCPGWLEAMLAPLGNPEVVAVKGRYYSRQRSPVARFAQLEFEEKYQRLERSARVDFVDSGTAAFRRDALLGVGGFDEDFPPQSAEDVELAFRLAEQGAHFAFNPRAAVLHRHAEGLSAYLVKKARYGYFRVRVYRRFPRKALGDSYTPPTMGLQIGLAGLATLVSMLGIAHLPWSGWMVSALLASFTLTTLPLARRAAGRRQPGLAMLVPALVFARAFAQGLGILAGLGALLAERGTGAWRASAPAQWVRPWYAGALVGLAVLVSLVPVARGYRTLCAGPVDTYPALAAARDEARQDSSGGAPAAAVATALNVLLRIKQADEVAFPAHVAAGIALELGGCPTQATGDQWRKAAAHASADWAADIAAAGLVRTMSGSTGQQATLVESLQRYAQAEPWHAANLGRVQAALLALAKQPSSQG